MSENSTAYVSEYNDYNEIIRKMRPELQKGHFEFGGMLATTYGLDVGVLENIYSILEIGRDVNMVDIFYDSHDIRNRKEFAKGENFHPMFNKKIAFHPKLIILKYVNGNTTRYGVIVSSRNLTSTNLVDGFVSMVSEDIDENSPENEQSKYLYDFIASFDKSNKNYTIKYESLQKAVFKGDGLSFEFADSEKLGKIINQQMESTNDMIVFSPFVTYSSNKNNNCVIVTNPAYVKAARNITDKVYVFFDSNDNNDEKNEESSRPVLGYNKHIKLYCWKKAEDKDTETVIALGSSNFTNNGLGINMGNIELNCIITKKDGGTLFDSLKRDLENWSKLPENANSEENSNTEIANTKSYIKDLYNYLTEHKIKISKNGEDYSLSLDLSDWYKADETKNAKISVSDATESENKLEWTTKVPIDICITITVTNTAITEICSFGYEGILDYDDNSLSELENTRKNIEERNKENFSERCIKAILTNSKINIRKTEKLSEPEAEYGGSTDKEKSEVKYIDNSPQLYEMLKILRHDLEMRFGEYADLCFYHRLYLLSKYDLKDGKNEAVSNLMEQVEHCLCDKLNKKDELINIIISIDENITREQLDKMEVFEK